MSTESNVSASANGKDRDVSDRPKSMPILYKSGFGEYCAILARAERILEETKTLDPHIRLGLITTYSLEVLRDEEKIKDKRKAEILGKVIEHYRKKLNMSTWCDDTKF